MFLLDCNSNLNGWLDCSSLVLFQKGITKRDAYSGLEKPSGEGVKEWNSLQASQPTTAPPFGSATKYRYALHNFQSSSS